MLSGLKPNWSAENCTHEIQTSFLLRSCCRDTLSYPRMAIVPTIRTTFSLTRLVVVDT
jgi:hypothetical protein